MSSVVFYLQMHQPYRLRRYNVFDAGSNYFDQQLNRDLLHRVADRCYLPFLKMAKKLADDSGGQFKFGVSLTGSLYDQLCDGKPEVIELLQQLAAANQIELLGETYDHSLAFLYSRSEFDRDVARHRQLMIETFGQTPKVFRNTELLYNNQLADHLTATGDYVGVITEGTDPLLGYRSPNRLYESPGGMKLLLKNYRLSDDIAFRFSDRRWSEWPLTAEKFAGWLGRDAARSKVFNLFMDMETFGEHQRSESGIFDFFESLVGQIVADSKYRFMTPTECCETFDAEDVYDVPHTISWADTERDASAWVGNAMQSSSLHELYRLEDAIVKSGDANLLRTWRRMGASDHFYYMATKYQADGAVHKYFNPYESPYDAYINLMNVLENLRSRVEHKVPV